MKAKSWMVVANKERAKVYKIVKVGELQEVANFIHPDQRAKGSDYNTDRPGRAFDRMGGGRHAYEPKVSFDDTKCIVFAALLADFLMEAKKRGEFNHLYLVSEARFLGFLRRLWPKELSDCIEETFNKDVVSVEPSRLHELLEIVV